MPGSNRESCVNQGLVIGYMDTGAIERSIEGLPSLQWQKLLVHNNPEFTMSGPVSGLPLRSDPFKILIFGGISTKTFILDTRKDVNHQNGTARISTCPTNMT